jgi:hypothetical protein
MYNKKVLIDSLKNLGSAKAPVKRQDVLVDPSGNPMMKNGGLNEKPYKKVSVQKSNIQGKGLFADEPIRAGEIIGLSHIKSSFQKDGETYLKSKETPVIGTYYNHSDDNFNAGSIIQGNKRYLRALKNIQPGEEIVGNYYEDNDPTLESPDDFKKGGSLPKMPRKKNSRGYSRSLEATNKFFTENSFFAKSKSRKNKVYNPNAKYQMGGDPGDKFKERLMKRYPGMQGVYGAEGENLNIVKDPNYDARSAGYGDIEFIHPGQSTINYPNRIEKGGPEYTFTNPSPDKYTAVYNPKGANRGDVFLDMMHGMRDDPNYQPLLQNFEKAVRDTRGGDMTWYYEDDVKNDGYTDGQEQWDENYIDSQLRAQLAPGSIGMFSHGRRDYRLDRKYDSPEMRTAAKDIRNYLKGKPTEEDYIEAELTEEEIEEYRKGGFIIEDISVPELTKANLGKVVKTVTKAPPVRRYTGTIIGPAGVSKTAFPRGTTNILRGTTTILPKINPTQIDLKNIPADLKALQINYPLSINGDSGYLSVHPNNKAEDNVFHFSTKMTSPLEAGKAFKIANDVFPQPFPSILEPHSLSLDSYNVLLNMANKKDWDMNFENHIPLNFASTHSKLFEGLDNVPRGLRSVRQWDPKAAEEMVSRVNADLQGRGLTEQAYLQLIPGSNTGEIRIPNYKLTRKYNLGGVAKVASKITPGNALRASLYKGVNPANYNILEKFTGVPSELYNNTLNNSNRPFRTGMSLKFGVPEHLSQLLNHLDVSKTQWDKFSEADKIMAIKDYDPQLMMKLEDVGKRRLDAWAVGLKQPQEYNTLEQIGDNTYKMLGLEHTPQFFAERKNDIIVNSFKGQAWDGKRDMLVGLTKDFYDLSLHPLQRVNPEDNRWAGLRRSQIDKFLGQPPAYHSPWNQTFKVGKSPDSEFTDAIYDNDSYGVRGGYRWDVRDTPEGMQWKAYDKWDLNPFERRGTAFLKPSPIMNKYLHANYFKPLQNLEALSLVGGRPFNIENNFLIDPKTYKTIKQWRKGGPAPMEFDPPIEENDPSSTLIDANSYFSNWYGNRQLPFDEIGNKTYERTLKQFLPAYNPQSPLLDELNQSVPYEYASMINNDPTVMGELIYDDEGDAEKILLNEKLKANPKELNSTITHEERTRLWDKFGDKILPAEQIIIQPNLKSFEEGWGNLKGADKKQAREYYDYLTDPSQDNIQSLIFEVRQSKGLQPTQVITEDDIKSWKSEAEKSGALDKNSPSYDPALYNLFKVVKDEKGLKDLFNYIAKNDSEEEMQYAQQGGSIDYELGDEIDEATMQQLKKLGYTFEKI